VGQYDASCLISRNALRELRHSTIDILADDDKRDTQQQQQQEAEQEEQGEHGHNSSGNGDSNNNNDQDSDESEGPRPAKRRRLSRSKHICKRRLRQRQDSCSAPVQAPECASSQSQRSSTRSSPGDEEPTSNTRAEYQEWPMHGFFKRTTIGDEIRYGMEFSLEQLHELCALACPHASRAGSSIRSIGSSRPPPQAKKTRSGPPSQIKGTRFTQEEDAKLIDMKETKRYSWDEIEGAFPGRTRATLQVHYSTKLKNRSTTRRKDDTR
jgi:hypothetical protein